MSEKRAGHELVGSLQKVGGSRVSGLDIRR